MPTGDVHLAKVVEMRAPHLHRVLLHLITGAALAATLAAALAPAALAAALAAAALAHAALAAAQAAAADAHRSVDDLHGLEIRWVRAHQV